MAATERMRILFRYALRSKVLDNVPDPIWLLLLSRGTVALLAVMDPTCLHASSRTWTFQTTWMMKPVGKLPTIGMAP